ncbi:MAG: UDPGP type 1 family protein [Planctomycetes bacterium]|nr:UDPGP type 1 family protein [Planctomycetota bacterium]
MRYREALELLRPRAQDHVLRWWAELNEAQRARLLEEIASVPWDVVDRLIPSHVLGRPATPSLANLQPAPVFPRTAPAGKEAYYRDAENLGCKLLRETRVAALTVAGGQGTRLGIDGPKGAVVVTPAGHRTLFELFAAAIVEQRRRSAAPIPWYIMTSPANHEQTIEFFRARGWLGLPREDLFFFSQGMLPAFDRHGRLLMEARDRLSLAPDGHGGTLKALARSGGLTDMRRRGVEIVSYFQVDNPLVRPLDPLFIGLHARTGSEMSTKVLPKAEDLECVGNLCLRDGKLAVIEYSEFPEALAHARNADGTRRFDSGNAAIHLLNVPFVERVSGHLLPYRRAEKTVPCIDDEGRTVRPTAPNAVKLETFIFDVLPLAENPLLFQIERAEEFSPVKNPTGVDSLESSRRDQIRRACRWLEAAGVAVPRRADGTPDVDVGIDPGFALEAADVAAKRERIPPLRAGDTVWIE